MSAIPGSSTPRQNEPNSKAAIKLRLRLPVVWLLFLLLGAVILPDRIWNTMLIGFGGLFIVAFFWAWQLSIHLQATRRLRFGWVAVGDRLEEEFTLSNESELPALWVEIIDESNVPGYQAAVVRSVNMRHVDRWRESAVCYRRGLFHLGPWAIRSGDPFGIFSVTRHYPERQDIIIHPPIHIDLPVPLPLGQSSGRTRARQRSWLARINAATVRDYQTRDPFNWIHWPTSARRGDLYVREFDLDAAGDIWILLDLQAEVQLAAGEVDGTEEHVVLLAASLAARAIDQTRPVGLATYGQQPQFIPPGVGQGQRWKILRALALVSADGTASLNQGLRDLNRMARRGAAVVIITASADSQWLPELSSLNKHGLHANIILLDRASFGGVGNTKALQEAINNLGYLAHTIHKGEIGRPAEEQARRGYWEFKITATGKAIAVRRPGEE